MSIFLFTGWLRRASVYEKKQLFSPIGYCVMGHWMCPTWLPWSLHPGDKDDELDSAHSKLLLRSTWLILYFLAFDLSIIYFCFWFCSAYSGLQNKQAFMGVFIQNTNFNEGELIPKVLLHSYTSGLRRPMIRAFQWGITKVWITCCLGVTSCQWLDFSFSYSKKTF